MKADFETLPILLQKAREALVAPTRQTLALNDLTEQQWRVIRTTFMNGELNAQTLAAQSAILGPSLSRILNRLDEEGVLQRKTSPGDQRELVISLTAKGKRLHQRIEPKVQADYESLKGKISATKLNQLAELLVEVAQMSEDL